jgi:two-component system, NarL family, nitrate/nitrite response regulator NarL
MEQKTRPVRVVIVDEEPALAYGLKTLLTDADDEITVAGVATRAEDGLKLVADNLPDVVILDVRMNGSSGLDFARTVRTDFPATRVLMFTVSEDRADIGTAVKLGVHGYLSKRDTSPSNLAEALRLVKDGKLVFSNGVLEEFEIKGSAPPPWVTANDLDLIRMISQGMANHAIARGAALSLASLKRRLQALQGRLGLVNRVQLVAHAVREGWI